MSFQTARRDIEKRLQSNWVTTDIAFPNIPFDPPKNGDDWVRLRIFEGQSNRITIGVPGVHRANGLIVVEIHTDQKSGTRAIFGYADTIAAIFRDVQFNGITCREASISDTGTTPDGWYKVDVTIPFYWDGVY